MAKMMMPKMHDQMAKPTGPTGILASGPKGMKTGGTRPTGKPKGLSSVRGSKLSMRKGR